MIALESRMDALESRVDALDSKVDALESKFNALDSRVTFIEANMATNMDIARLSADIARLDSKLDSYQRENISADEFLLREYRTTSEKLDFHRDKIAKLIEDVHLLQRPS